jgi:hypothetical protein
MTRHDKQLRIHVEPEPTPEELAAIVAAVGTLQMTVSDEGVPESPMRGRDRWAKAGRREVLRAVEWERPA